MNHPPLSTIALASALVLTSFATSACDMPPPETEDNCVEVEVATPEQADGQSLQTPPEASEVSVSTPVGPEYDAGQQGVTGTYMQITRKIVRAHLPEVKHCYDLGLKQDPQLAGRIVVKFKITGDGSVGEAEIASSDLANETVSDCIVSRVERWKFAKPRNGEEVVIHYPFVLRSDDNAPATEVPELAPLPKMDVEGDTGGISKKVIRRIVRAHINEVRFCYNEGLTRDPELAGRIVVGFTIGADGNVVESKVAETTLGDSSVDTCIATAVGRWKFP
ncbi:MAG: AgmX/PglI C-terminal domain-containing protein, partial [Nannocystaceae bacterium]